MPYKQQAAARTFAIGKTLDSPDDMTRLMLITDHAGENMVRVFAPGDPAEDAVSGTKAGYLTIEDDGTIGADVNNVPLTSLGMFYPTTPATPTSPSLVFGDPIAANAEPTEVFSYVDPSVAQSETEDGVRYAALRSKLTAGDTTTYNYTTGADIEAAEGAPDGLDTGADPDDAQVTVPIPGPVAYQHLHFGVWASLGEAMKDGTQEVDELGIGFVQNIGDGMTETMPIRGTLTHNGNWAATVQRSAGAVSLEHGAATLEANIAKATLTATLTGLAKLEGDLDGSMFSGTKATPEAGNIYGLRGKFAGDFSGGYYGADAAEAGGIFDFSSTTSGAFRGAFGGKMMEDAS